MVEKERILVVQFKNRISKREVSQFRGGVNQILNRGNVLFHNHKDDNFVYHYPLIQYKQLGGSATLVCLGEGTEAIGDFFGCCNLNITIGQRKEILEIASVKAEQCLVQVWNDMFSYRLSSWLPFNSTNYAQYTQLEGLSDKYRLLEQILTGNILSFAKGLNIQLQKEVVSKIISLSDAFIVEYKGVKMMGFDLMFKSNDSLPSYIGLGKGVSLGNGTVKRINKQAK